MTCLWRDAQDTIVNNLALKWEDAEEERLRTGQEDMQQGNPKPVKASAAKQVGNLFWRNKPRLPPQPPDTCAQLLQIPKVRTLELALFADLCDSGWTLFPKSVHLDEYVSEIDWPDVG